MTKNDHDDKRTNKKKKKRHINIEDDSESEEDEDAHVKKRKKFSDLGLNLKDDYIEIDKIKERPLPREDGYLLDKWADRPSEADKRPYNKKYLEDQAERQKILSNNKDFRFVSELAGALRKELSDIVDPENLARIRQEQELERAETDVELKRTRISMERKYDLLKKLKLLLKEEEDTLKNTRREEMSSHAMRQLSQYLVDDNAVSTFIPHSTDFLSFVSLHDSYGAGGDNARDIARDAFFLTEEKSMGTQPDLYYALLIFFRDFLNNESNHTLFRAVTSKVNYVLKHYNDLGKEDGRATDDNNNNIVKVEDLVETKEDTTKLLTRIGLTEKEREILEKDPFSATTVPVLNTSTTSTTSTSVLSSVTPVNWSEYKKRITETIDLPLFEQLKIDRRIEGEMAKIGAEAHYDEPEYKNYVKRAIDHLYGDNDEAQYNATRDDDFIKQSTGNRTGLALLSRYTNNEQGGHPKSIFGLIQIQYDLSRVYEGDEKKELIKRIEDLLRSHFLWHFFEELSTSDKPDSVIPPGLATVKDQVVENIRQRTEPAFKETFRVAMILYKSLLMDYLMHVARVLMLDVIRLTPEQEAAFFDHPRSPTNAVIDADRFDRVNTLFKGLLAKDVIADGPFKDYFDAYIRDFDKGQSELGEMDVETSEGGMRRPLKKLLEHSEYPVLLLHHIYKLYMDKYVRNQITASTKNIERLKDAIDKATQKLTEVVGEEKYALTRRAEYRQRKEYTSRVENSGFIKLRSEIEHLLKKAYHLVHDYCVALRDLPFEAYQSESAQSTGLTTDFIGFVAVLSADLELMFPDGYRSARFHTKIKEEKHTAMARLKRYTWTGGRYGQPYVVRKIVDMTPFFATPEYHGRGAGGGSRNNSSNTLMF